MNVPGAVRLTGPLQADSLERALNQIVRRHESLRTTFAHDGSALRQVIAEDDPATLKVVDLSNLPREDREAEASRLAHSDARAPFDLANGPVFRASLLKLAEHEHILLINIHHIVTDGWSMGVLTRELTALYSELTGSPKERIAPLPLQFGDYGELAARAPCRRRFGKGN